MQIKMQSIGAGSGNRLQIRTVDSRMKNLFENRAIIRHKIT